MAKIPVPKPAAGSMNKDRKVSELLRWQMRHMREAERKLAEHHQTRTNIEAIKTEGEASEYIKKVTQKLHSRYKVKVPKPGRESMNKHRPISDLIKAQIKHLSEVEKTLPPEKHSGIDIESITTEHEASGYIRTITAHLHPQSASNKK